VNDKGKKKKKKKKKKNDLGNVRIEKTRI